MHVSDAKRKRRASLNASKMILRTYRVLPDVIICTNFGVIRFLVFELQKVKNGGFLLKPDLTTLPKRSRADK